MQQTPSNAIVRKFGIAEAISCRLSCCCAPSASCRAPAWAPHLLFTSFTSVSRARRGGCRLHASRACTSVAVHATLASFVWADGLPRLHALSSVSLKCLQVCATEIKSVKLLNPRSRDSNGPAGGRLDAGADDVSVNGPFVAILWPQGVVAGGDGKREAHSLLFHRIGVAKRFLCAKSDELACNRLSGKLSAGILADGATARPLELTSRSDIASYHLPGVIIRAHGPGRWSNMHNHATARCRDCKHV